MRRGSFICWCILGLLLIALPATAQEDATRTAQSATESVTPSVIPELPTLTYTPTPEPPTVVPTQPPTRIPTTTPQIDGDIIVNIGANLEFPDTVEFFLLLAEPIAGDTNIRLEIEAASLIEPVLATGTAEDFQVENEPERLIYRWQFEPDNAPSMFDTLTYRWSVLMPEGENTASSEVILTDPRAVWITSTLADGKLLVLNANRQRARLSSNLEQVYRFLQSLTGETPELHFMIYEDDLQPACGVNTCVAGLYADIYQRSGYIPLVTTDELEVDLTRQLVNTFYASLWEDADVPAWWLEGFSRYLSPMATPQMLLTSQTTERAGQTFSLEEMAVRPTETAQQSQWDAQAYGMVLYTLSQIGRDGLFELATVPGSKFAETFQTSTGQSINTIVPGWSRWIFTESAPAVYGLTPYLPATSTPSVTPTPSLTITPTFTSTGTSSATFTYTPDLRTQTEPPTVTPMPSATESPPTATPRSMNALLTPEPQSTNVVSTEGPDTRTIVVGTLILLIVILIVVFVMSMRRK